MLNLRIIVLVFLQKMFENPIEKFNEGFDLYRQLPNKNNSALVHYNRFGYTEQNLLNLCYDLQKLCQITDVEVLTPIDDPIIEIDQLPQYLKDFTQEELLDWLQNVDDESRPLLGVSEVLELAKKENNELIISTLTAYIADNTDAENPVINLDAEQFDIDASFPKAGVEIIKKELGADATVTKKEASNVREEFAFLNDENCPTVFYEIVGRRITAFKTYQKGHGTLQKVAAKELELTNEETLALTKKTNDAFTENQLLWDELNHFKDKGEILGKHPMFKESNIQKEVDLMSIDAMIKFINSSPKFFHDQKAKLVKYKKDAVKLEKVNQLIGDRNYKLSLVKAKSGYLDGTAKAK
jgi:heme oxygenase